jgi:integrase
MDAEAWLNAEWLLLERNQWVPPSRRGALIGLDVSGSGVTVREYAQSWLARSRVRATTRQLYERLLRIHILPVLGDLRLGGLRKIDVREWWAGLDHEHQRTCDLAYSLLRTIAYAAVDDEIIEVNPVQVKGAGRGSRPRSMEPLTPQLVQALSVNMPPEWAVGVLLGSWCALRSGEIRELRRGDIDLESGIVRVTRAVNRVSNQLVVNTPKTDAGKRNVLLPQCVLETVREHIELWAQPGENGLLLWDRSTGKQIHDTVFRVAFRHACEVAGVKGYRFHDLRHTGLTYAATVGATIRELQAMAGHTTATMAMRYQEIASRHLVEVNERLNALIVGG